MRVIVLALCVLVSALSGCASMGPTTDKFDAQCKTWVGQPTESLIAAWGIPAKDYQVDSDTKMLEYQLGGGSMLTPSPMGWANIERSCKVTFTAKSGTVTNYNWQGNSCRSN